jgi:hypothetical protein
LEEKDKIHAKCVRKKFLEIQILGPNDCIEVVKPAADEYGDGVTALPPASNGFDAAMVLRFGRISFAKSYRIFLEALR